MDRFGSVLIAPLFFLLAWLYSRYLWWNVHARAGVARRGEPPFSMDDQLTRWIPTSVLGIVGLVLLIRPLIP